MVGYNSISHVLITIHLYSQTGLNLTQEFNLKYAIYYFIQLSIEA